LDGSDEGNGSRGGRPQSAAQTTVPGSTQPGPEAASGAIDTQRAPGADSSDRWGELPTHAREVFRNNGGGDLPPYYRDWIDQYYRRLNAQR
jgi:hypothetical protein